MSSATCHISSALPDIFIVTVFYLTSRLCAWYYCIIFNNEMWASKWALLSVFTSVKAPGFSCQIYLAVRSQTGRDGWAECWGMFTVCVCVCIILTGTKLIYIRDKNLHGTLNLTFTETGKVCHYLLTLMSNVNNYPSSLEHKMWIY